MEVPSAAIRRAYGVRRTLALSKFTSGISRNDARDGPRSFLPVACFMLAGTGHMPALANLRATMGDATPRSFLPGGHRHRARLLDCGSALTVDVREQRRHFLAVQPQVRH